MNKPVFVAGTGMISAIGNNSSECLDALLNGRDGIAEMTYLNSIHYKNLVQSIKFFKFKIFISIILNVNKYFYSLIFNFNIKIVMNLDGLIKYFYYCLIYFTFS